MSISIGTAVNFINIAAPIISKVAPVIQTSMKGFADRLLEISDKYPSIQKFAQMIDKAADVMGDVLYVLGVNADRADVLGVKASECKERVDDFDSAEAYIKHLTEDIKADNEKLDALTPEERVVYSIVGMSIMAAFIGEKLGVEVSADSVEMLSKIIGAGTIAVDAAGMKEFVQKIKATGITNMNDICDCINGTGDSDRIKTAQSMIKVLDEIHPNEGTKILNEIVDVVRE